MIKLNKNNKIVLTCIVCRDPKSQVDFLYKDNDITHTRGGVYYIDKERDIHTFIHEFCKNELIKIILSLDEVCEHSCKHCVTHLNLPHFFRY